MNSTKWWLVLVTVLLACGGLVGCGSDDDDNDNSAVDDDNSVADDDTTTDDDEADDDELDDDVADDDTADDDTMDDDTIDDDTLDDDTTDDDITDDDSVDDDTAADVYMAPWPQQNVHSGEYDETLTAGALRTKAEGYDAFHLAHHQPYYGGTVDANFTDDTYTVPESYGGWGDSCIWTGTYLGSQALRYWVTGDAQAKQNSINMVNTLDGYLHVTGRPGFIARYWAPQDSISYGGDEWCDDPNQDRCHHWEDGEFAGDWWWGETSRDQYTGWFFGNTMAYDLVDDETMRQKIRDNVTEVLDELIANNWWIIDEAGEPTDAAPNIMPMFRLAWSLMGYHITGEERFKEQVQVWLRDSKRTAFKLSNLAFMNRYAQYYGNNLSHTNWFNILRLGKVYFSAEDYAFFLDVFETQVHTFTRLSHNAWFNGVFMNFGDYQPSNNVKDDYLDQLLTDLSDFRAAPNYSYYLPARTGYTVDPFSELMYNLQQQFPWLEELMGSVSVQALDAFPILEQCSTGFLFQRNPFQIEECGYDDVTDVNPGVDYLVAYWLAAYGEFVTKDM